MGIHSNSQDAYSGGLVGVQGQWVSWELGVVDWLGPRDWGLGMVGCLGSRGCVVSGI